MAYDVGSLVRVKVAFTDSSGNAQDPTAVYLKTKSGKTATTVQATTATNPAIVKDSTGNYHYDIDTTGEPGRWTYRWWSTGTGQAASDSFFDVDFSALA